MKPWRLQFIDQFVEMEMPFLLLMPSYNQSHFIVDAVKSVLAQDDGDWELWIVDNSTDSTPTLMREFTDPRIRFHHIAARMDPGSCLNWMLQRAVGREFSYIHTDNNLHPSFVRRMRGALQGERLGLAYCDMRTIDEHGAYLNVYRRGHFDLPRLMSIDTLGVPFAATTELAREVGGFSVKDFADDVVFCVGSYGLAHYVYLPDALVDYRLHSASRTEEVGGSTQMERVFVKMMTKIAPNLEKRGIQPLPAMRQAIREGFDDLDLFVEDLWHRKISRWLKPWWKDHARFDHFFFAGLTKVQGFNASSGQPPKRPWVRDGDDRLRVAMLGLAVAHLHLFSKRRDLRRRLKRLRNMLMSWATLELKPPADTAVAFRVVSADFRTLWAARQLQLALGWTPLLDRSIKDAPRWLSWDTANGSEPALDCSNGIRFGR